MYRDVHSLKFWIAHALPPPWTVIFALDYSSNGFDVSGIASSIIAAISILSYIQVRKKSSHSFIHIVKH